MKQIFLILVCVVFSINTRAQENDSLTSGNSDYQIKDDGDQVEIVTDEVVKKDKKDTTKFTLGDKEINIIEENGETTVKVKDLNDENEDENDTIEDSVEEKDYTYTDDEDKDKDNDSKDFKGHWAGFEFGLNNYVNSDFSMTRTAETEFMDINTGKSWNFNFNFAQYSFPVISDRFGVISGMGIEWSNYHFENQNTIKKIDGIIQPVDLTVEPIKNRFQTTYLTIPLIVEAQILKGNRNDRLYVAGGLIGGIKLFSNTKVKYNEDGAKQKDKNRGDYYLRPFRYAVTGRIGYKMVKLYFNYYLTSLFLDERGPELYPVATGLAITF